MFGVAAAALPTPGVSTCNRKPDKQVKPGKMLMLKAVLSVMVLTELRKIGLRPEENKEHCELREALQREAYEKVVVHRPVKKKQGTFSDCIKALTESMTEAIKVTMRADESTVFS